MCSKSSQSQKRVVKKSVTSPVNYDDLNSKSGSNVSNGRFLLLENQAKIVESFKQGTPLSSNQNQNAADKLMHINHNLIK